MSRNLNDLKPEVAKKARKLVKVCKEQGISLLVTSTLRTREEQEEVYAHGRTKPGPIVTYNQPGNSKHELGLAFDVVPTVAGKPVWESLFWKRIGTIGQALGLKWGGDFWGFRNHSHFEEPD